MDANDGIDNSDDDEDNDFMKFALPGDKGFVEDRPLKQRMSRGHAHQGDDGRGESGDDESSEKDEDEMSYEGRQYRYDEINESVMQSSRKRGYDSTREDDDDDDDDDDGSMRTPRKIAMGNKKCMVTAEKRGREEV